MSNPVISVQLQDILGFTTRGDDSRYGLKHIDLTSNKIEWGDVRISAEESDRMVDEVFKMEAINGAHITMKTVDHHADGSSTITIAIDGESFMRGRDELVRTKEKFKWLVAQLNAQQLTDMGLIRWEERHRVDLSKVDLDEIIDAIDERFANYEKATHRLLGKRP